MVATPNPAVKRTRVPAGQTYSFTEHRARRQGPLTSALGGTKTIGGLYDYL